MARDNWTYETVAASQTDQMLGGSGAKGDILERLIIVPATTAPGVVQIKDGDGSAITVYTGGTVGADLTPIVVDVHAICTAATTPGWKVTTGANVSVVAIGRFS